METSIELLKLALQIASAEKNMTSLRVRLKVAGNADLLTMVLAIDQQLRSELATRATPSSPNTAT